MRRAVSSTERCGKELTDIVRIESEEDIQEVATLARQIWTEHYVPIIGPDQVEYMLGRLQSAEAIAAQIADGYEYYLLSVDDESVGYLALVPDDDGQAIMISKLYVHKSGRGSGLGWKMLEFAEEVCRERGVGKLWLTVNKNNVDSIAWYERVGFVVSNPLVQDIGGGFVMDDYRLEKMVEV